MKTDSQTAAKPALAGDAGSAFVVTAYRWGQRNAHSYVVGVFATLEDAKACAEAHVDYRGGKYGCEVCEAKPWIEDVQEDSAEQVYYVESPYFGMAGDAGHFHPANMDAKAMPCPKPFTVRELQNRINDLERQLKQNNKLTDAPNKGPSPER